MQINHILTLAVSVLLTASVGSAQPPLFTDALPKEEFSARRARVMEAIGDGMAVMQGATETPAYERFRQSNQFFYLTGVEVPRAILLIDGRAKTSTLYVAPRNERMERSEGPILSPGAEAEGITGIDRVAARDDFNDVARQLAGRVVFTPFRGETRSAGTPDREAAYARARKADVWDGQPSREEWFQTKLKQQASGVEIKDLDPILDGMRLIKSPREIALVREATRIAGEGIMEAMRSAGPGMYEYELGAIADYTFRKNNSQGVGYYALVAAGKNASWPHYHASQTLVRDGDMVLFDYAPDFKYYTSDVTRMFPINGKFTPDQRELYTIYVDLYQALMTSIRPGRAGDILQDAVKKMDVVMASYKFTNPKYKEAAARFVEGYRTQASSGRGSLGHMVGMEVHDVTVPFEALKPGMIFTIEPALTIPEDRVYIRLEDMILITERGYENLSAFAPMDVAGIEKLMAETGFAEKGARKPGTAMAR
ncbi:MAG: aminopeptidase P family protein [Gemmatimonadaceae bacterium]|nr:aminopeptidase P family protein [Gemmatimonadaceae bacterium]